MLVIATDADHLKPTVIDTLVFTSGERYDFVLEANQTAGEYMTRSIVSVSLLFMYTQKSKIYSSKLYTFHSKYFISYVRISILDCMNTTIFEIDSRIVVLCVYDDNF